MPAGSALGRLAQRPPASTSERLDRRSPPAGRSARGLDWFVFFVADVQTGFGPFVAVYLTAAKWTQTDIGLVLTVGGLVSLFAQIPAGALVDRLRALRGAAAIAVAIIGLGAFLLAALPVFPVVLASRVMQAGASCVLGVSMAAISLNLVGQRALGARLGRNTAFASAGTGLAAAGMGACGYFLSNQAVFFVSALLVMPALFALLAIRPEDVAPRIDPDDEERSSPSAAPGAPEVRPSLWAGFAMLLRSRALVVFAGCIILFQMANATMLPLAASMLTLRSHTSPAIMVAGAIVVPQAIVTFLSPFVGKRADSWGRRPLLLIGLAALPLRGFLFAYVTHPQFLVVLQVLDGISAAVLGVLVPLIIADVAGRSGRFNLAQGAVGCAVGIGASISATVVGWVSDHLGSYTAFMGMGIVGVLAFLLALFAMPETRDASGQASLSAAKRDQPVPGGSPKPDTPL